MSQAEHSEFAAFVGLDWADAKHDVCFKAQDSEQFEYQIVPNRPEKIDEWARSVRLRFGGRPVALCLELDKGPIVYALRKYDFFILFPVNPQTLANYRKAWTPSRAKDDPSDARLALDILLKHRDKLRRLHPQSGAMRALQQLVEDRRQLVGERVRLTNRITYSLKNYFPQAANWFEDKGTILFCDFLQRWPTLVSARQTRSSGVDVAPAAAKRYQGEAPSWYTY